MSAADLFAARLDDEHRAALDLFPPELVDLTDIARARTMSAELLAAAAARTPPTTGVVIEDCVIPGDDRRPDLFLRLYRPESIPNPAPAMLFLHGGGFVMGSVALFDAQCCHLAAEGGVVVASVEYRLAPEHPFPTPLEDSYAALAWLHGQAAARGLAADRIGVGGTSAGAGLAAGLALLARDRGALALTFQFLEAPMLDHRNCSQSSLAVDHPRTWNRAANALAWKAYLGDAGASGSVSPYASPALAADLGGLAPAYICVSAADMFADECFDYAQRLSRAGVKVEFHLYEMGFHGSQRALPGAAVSQRWKADSALAIRRLVSS